MKCIKCRIKYEKQKVFSSEPEVPVILTKMTVLGAHFLYKPFCLVIHCKSLALHVISADGLILFNLIFNMEELKNHLNLKFIFIKDVHSADQLLKW